MLPQERSIAVIGLGYVGLPLAIEFGKQFDTLGFDINVARIEELQAGHDRTLETNFEEIASAHRLRFSCSTSDLCGYNVYIVSVPTPVDEKKNPDFTPLIRASETVGGALKNGDIVIYESTVYPGATEEVCVPVLERVSGLKFNADFFCGYSPERINPGDKERRLTEEATILDVPCLTLRTNTERPETVEHGSNELIGTKPEAIAPAMARVRAGQWKHAIVPQFWDGLSAHRIVDHLIDIL